MNFEPFSLLMQSRLHTEPIQNFPSAPVSKPHAPPSGAPFGVVEAGLASHPTQSDQLPHILLPCSPRLLHAAVAMIEHELGSTAAKEAQPEDDIDVMEYIRSSPFRDVQSPSSLHWPAASGPEQEVQNNQPTHVSPDRSPFPHLVSPSQHVDVEHSNSGEHLDSDEQPDKHPDAAEHPDEHPDEHPNAGQQPDKHPDAVEQPDQQLENSDEQPDVDEHPDEHPDVHVNAGEQPDKHPDSGKQPDEQPDADKQPHADEPRDGHEPRDAHEQLDADEHRDGQEQPDEHRDADEQPDEHRDADEQPDEHHDADEQPDEHRDAHEQPDEHRDADEQPDEHPDEDADSGERPDEDEDPHSGEEPDEHPNECASDVPTLAADGPEDNDAGSGVGDQVHGDNRPLSDDLDSLFEVPDHPVDRDFELIEEALDLYGFVSVCSSA